MVLVLSVTIIRIYFGKNGSAPRRLCTSSFKQLDAHRPLSHHWQGPLDANKPLQTNCHSKSNANYFQFQQPTRTKIHSAIRKSKERQKYSENDIKSMQIIIKWWCFVLTQMPPLLLLAVTSGRREALYDSLPPLPIKHTLLKWQINKQQHTSIRILLKQ